MNKRVQGIMRGRMIEIGEDLGIPDGEQVEMIVSFAGKKRPWGQGILSSAGALADSWTEEDDRILEEIYQDRKRTSRRDLPNELPAGQ
jgi:hypothetical protein